MIKKTIITAGIFGVSFLVVLFIIGTLHSHTKHPNGDQSIFSTLYRGVEFFWHDQYYETNWNKELDQDIQDIFGLLNNANTNENSDVKEKSKIDMFRKKIKDYPADNIAFLKRGGALYIAFNIAQDSDLLKRVVRDTLFYTPDFYSNKTKALMDSISKYQNADEALSVRKSINTVWGYKDSVIPLKENSIEIISSKNNEVHLKMKKIYDSIFSDL